MHRKCRALHYLLIGHLLVAGTNGQRVLITSVVPNQSLFCPREEVNITCVTRGSPTLTWTSNEYNKDGGNSLTLASFNQLGYSVRSPVNSDTIATLINKSNNTENGEQVLVSQLRIITLANFSISSITCLHDDGSMNSTGVQVLGDPDRPENLKANLRNGVEDCIILIEWDPPANVAADDMAYYWIQVNDSERVNETITPTAYRDCTCSPQTIQVSAVNRCEREGPSSVVSLNQGPTLLPNFGLQCDAPTTVQSTQPNCPMVSDSNNGQVTIGLGVSLSMLAIINIILIAILVITCCLQRKRETWFDVLKRLKCKCCREEKISA